MTLPLEYRARVLALYAEGKSYKEIEELTGCPPGTIASLAFQERKLNPLFPKRQTTRRVHVRRSRAYAR
jgi:Sigma-70, region 4